MSNPTRLFPTQIILLALAIVVSLMLRVHTFHEPVDCDEATYAFIGKTIVEGGLPYRDAWDVKPPGVLLLYAVAIAMGGYNELTVACIPLPFVALTVWLVFRVGRQLCGVTGGLCAAWLFALVSSDPFTFAQGSNTEVTINCLALASLDRMLAAIHSKKRRTWLVTGLLVGLAALFKHVAVAHLLVYLLACLALRLKDRRVAGVSRVSWRGVCYLCAGFLVPWLLAVLGAAVMGWEYLRLTLEMLFVYPLTLVSQSQDGGLAARLVDFFSPDNIRALTGTWPIWLLGTAAAIVLSWKRREANAYLVVGWTVACLVQIAMPGFYWPHYYMLGLPGMAVLTGSGLECLGGFTSARNRGKTVLRARFVLVVVVAGMQWHYYLRKSPEEISVEHQGTQWMGCRNDGRKWDQFLPKSESIFVWGIQSPLYFYSRRDCPTRYFFTDPVTELNPLDAAGFQGEKKQQIIKDLRRNPPAIVWSKIAMFPQLEQFLRDFNYLPMVHQDIESPDGQKVPVRFYLRADLAMPKGGTGTTLRF